MQPEHGFNLQGRYPSGGNGFKAAQIYELLAQQSEAIDSIQGLIEHFKTHSIWVWKFGAIEPHLCLEAKETGEWYKFKQDLNEKEIGVLNGVLWVINNKQNKREFQIYVYHTKTQIVCDIS